MEYLVNLFPGGEVSFYCFGWYLYRNKCEPKKIFDVLRDLAPFVKCKKKWRKTHGGLTFSKVKLLHGCFSRF